jgi:hypothetical protein
VGAVAVTEAELLREVERLCRRYDVVLDHRYQPLYDRPGWPDCSLLGTRAVAFRELKNARRKVTPAQQQTGERMRGCGLDWDVWRPRDLESGRAEREIAALSGKRPWTAA